MSRLISEIEEHRVDGIIIARNGNPVARLQAVDAVDPDSARQRVGAARGAFVVPEDIDTPYGDLHALGRDDMPVSGKEALHWFSVSGYRDLGITSRHTAAVGKLPQIHTDPFDRLLVAQAHAEPPRQRGPARQWSYVWSYLSHEDAAITDHGRPCIVVRPYSRKREVREVFGDLSGVVW